MNITPEQKRRITQCINVFESGKREGNVGALAYYNDGPGGMKQVTYGMSQATEFGGNLGRIITAYCDHGGEFADKLKIYTTRIGAKPSLCDDHAFIFLLQQAARDPIMEMVQRDVFDRYYYDPACHWCDGERMVLPLSLLVVYDSFIHSGQIRPDIRQRFPETTPRNNGNEKAWVSAYVKARAQWLADRGYGATVYRMKTMRDAITANNWDLSAPINANGITV